MLAANVAWAEGVKANAAEQLMKVAENKSRDFHIDRAILRKEDGFASSARFGT